MPRSRTKSKKLQGKPPSEACVFCGSEEDNDEVYGKLLKKNDITVHYFCMLFSSGLWQRGKRDRDGILGFMPADIYREQKRGSRLTCLYCRKKGATIGCVISNCRKTFHFGCGREAGVLFQFFQQFRSYCSDHRPCQETPTSDRLAFYGTAKSTCSICMLSVETRASNDTLRSPCCRKAWFHRNCLQRYATSAGAYFFKCPLCNNKELFEAEMLEFGIYIPEQDAAWEQDPLAFNDLLERYSRCDTDNCLCPEGREYTGSPGSRWELKLCDWCGSSGTHTGCHGFTRVRRESVCKECAQMSTKVEEEQNKPSKPCPPRQTMSSPEAIRRQLEQRRSASLRAQRAARRHSSPPSAPNVQQQSEREQCVLLQQNHELNAATPSSWRGRQNAHIATSTLFRDGRLAESTPVVRIQKAESESEVNITDSSDEKSAKADSGKLSESSSECFKDSVEPASITSVQCQYVSNGATSNVRNVETEPKQMIVIDKQDSSNPMQMHMQPVSAQISEAEGIALEQGFHSEQLQIGTAETVNHSEQCGEVQHESSHKHKQPSAESVDTSKIHVRGRPRKMKQRWQFIESEKQFSSVSMITRSRSCRVLRINRPSMASSNIRVSMRCTRSALKRIPFFHLPQKPSSKFPSCKTKRVSSLSIHKLSNRQQNVLCRQNGLMVTAAKTTVKRHNLESQEQISEDAATKHHSGRSGKRKQLQHFADTCKLDSNDDNNNLSADSGEGTKSQSLAVDSSNMPTRFTRSALAQFPLADTAKEKAIDFCSETKHSVISDDEIAVKRPKLRHVQSQDSKGTMADDSGQTKGRLDVSQSSQPDSSTSAESLTIQVRYDQGAVQCARLSSALQDKHDSHEDSKECDIKSKSKPGLSADAHSLQSSPSSMTTLFDPVCGSSQNECAASVNMHQGISGDGESVITERADSEPCELCQDKGEQVICTVPPGHVAVDSKASNKQTSGSKLQSDVSVKASSDLLWNQNAIDSLKSPVCHDTSVIQSSVPSSCTHVQEPELQSTFASDPCSLTSSSGSVLVHQHNTCTEWEQSEVIPLDLQTRRTGAHSPNSPRASLTPAPQLNGFADQCQAGNLPVRQFGPSCELAAHTHTAASVEVQMSSATASASEASVTGISSSQINCSQFQHASSPIPSTDSFQIGVSAIHDQQAGAAPVDAGHESCLTGVGASPKPQIVPESSEPHSGCLSNFQIENVAVCNPDAFAKNDTRLPILSFFGRKPESQDYYSPLPRKLEGERLPHNQQNGFHTIQSLPEVSMAEKPSQASKAIQCPIALVSAQLQSALVSPVHELSVQPHPFANTSSESLLLSGTEVPCSGARVLVHAEAAPTVSFKEPDIVLPQPNPAFLHPNSQPVAAAVVGQQYPSTFPYVLNQQNGMVTVSSFQSLPGVAEKIQPQFASLAGPGNSTPMLDQSVISYNQMVPLWPNNQQSFATLAGPGISTHVLDQSVIFNNQLMSVWPNNQQSFASSGLQIPTFPAYQTGPILMNVPAIRPAEMPAVVSGLGVRNKESDSTSLPFYLPTLSDAQSLQPCAMTANPNITIFGPSCQQILPGVGLLQACATGQNPVQQNLVN